MPGRGTSKRFPHGKSIKHAKVYDALRRKGMGKSQAARISNSVTPRRGRKRK